MDGISRKTGGKPELNRVSLARVARSKIGGRLRVPLTAEGATRAGFEAGLLFLEGTPPAELFYTAAPNPLVVRGFAEGLISACSGVDGTGALDGEKLELLTDALHSFHEGGKVRSERGLPSDLEARSIDALRDAAAGAPPPSGEDPLKYTQPSGGIPWDGPRVVLGAYAGGDGSLMRASQVLARDLLAGKRPGAVYFQEWQVPEIVTGFRRVGHHSKLKKLLQEMADLGVLKIKASSPSVTAQYLVDTMPDSKDAPQIPGPFRRG